jgi:hypothetical protein
MDEILPSIQESSNQIDSLPVKGAATAPMVIRGRTCSLQAEHTCRPLNSGRPLRNTLDFEPTTRPLQASVATRKT